MTDNVYIFPTDTVWGIGAALSGRTAQKRMAEIKGITRPRPYALIFDQLAHLAAWFTPAAPLPAYFWQEILACHTTLLFPVPWLRKEAAEAAAGRDKVGVRWQPNEAIEKIWQREQEPIISTSLNLSGQAPITDEVVARRFAQQYAADATLYTAEVLAQATASTILAIELAASLAAIAQVADAFRATTDVAWFESPIFPLGKVQVKRGDVTGPLAQALRRMGLDVDRN